MKGPIVLLPILMALVGLPSIGTPRHGSTHAAETFTETVFARESFNDPNWSKRWIVEGDATLEAKDGKLRISTQQATLWWRTALPADVSIELRAGVDGPAENNAANLNLIVHAREREAAPYRFGRSARYEEYHTIPNYIATLTGGFEDGWSRLRRNPGFTILSEKTSARSEVGRSYRIKLVVAGGRIRYWLDDELLHDVVDPQPLQGGHFALRTWRSRVWWSDIRFARSSK